MEELLPRLRVDPTNGLAFQPTEVFGRGIEALHLEIGFGGGEHLLARARTHPDTGFIGCEPFVNGVAKLLGGLEAEHLTNVRIWDDDVTRFLAALPSACLDRVYLLYPDPWPKRRQRKRRLLSDALLVSLARCMRPGAELRFATDIDDYAGWALVRVFRSPLFRWSASRRGDWTTPWEGWEETRYESKARQNGRGATYLTFERIAED